jgi:hypothetical protein
VCCGTESMTEPSLPEEPIFAQALEIGSPTERAAAVRRFECLRSPFAWVPGGRSLRRPQPPARIGRTSMLFGTGLKPYNGGRRHLPLLAEARLSLARPLDLTIRTPNWPGRFCPCCGISGVSCAFLHEHA